MRNGLRWILADRIPLGGRLAGPLLRNAKLETTGRIRADGPQLEAREFKSNAREVKRLSLLQSGDLS